MSDDQKNTLTVSRGEALKAQIDYANEDGTPLNLSLYTLSCPEASHDELKDEVILTFVNQAKGIASVEVPAEFMNVLPSGRSSWLRLAFTLTLGGDPSISQKLWIDIQ